MRPLPQPGSSKRQHGFTLIEALVVVAITGIIALALAAFVGRSFNVSREQFEQVRITEDARKEIERVADTVRKANNVIDPVTSETQERWLQYAGNYDLLIHSNVDDDPELEKVHYFIEEGTTDLKRTVLDIATGESTTATLVRTVRNRTLAAGGAPPEACTLPTSTDCPPGWTCQETGEGTGTCLPPHLFTYYSFGTAGELVPVSDITSLDVTQRSRVARVGIRLVVDVNEQQHPGAVNITTDVTPRIFTVGATAILPPGGPQCSDGLDNDGDGKIDYGTDYDLNDPGCASPTDDNEFNYPVPPGVPYCRDENDNDGDGLIDEGDPGCSPGGIYRPNKSSEKGGLQCDSDPDEDGDNDGVRYLTDGSGDLNCESAFDNIEDGPLPCPTSPISLPGTVSGSLDAFDCPYGVPDNDPFVFPPLERYADMYTFTTTTPNEKIKIALEATNRDHAYPHLYLLQGEGIQGTQIAEAEAPCNETDTFSKTCLPQTNFNQGITVATPGTYTIVVTSFFGGDIYDYTLSLLKLPVACSSTPVTISAEGITYPGELSETDCLQLDPINGQEQNVYADLYTFTIASLNPLYTRNVQFTLEGTSNTQMQPRLFVKKDSTGSMVDDGNAVACEGDYSNNKVCAPINIENGGYLTLGIGTYTVVASTDIPSSFTYDLTIKEYVPPPCSTTEMTLSLAGQTLDGTLAAPDCFATELPGSYADLYTFTTSAPNTKVQIIHESCESGGLCGTEDWSDGYPILYLKNSLGQILASDTATNCVWPGAACIPDNIFSGGTSFTVTTPGAYTIVATSNWSSASGRYPIDYKVTLQEIPAGSGNVVIITPTPTPPLSTPTPTPTSPPGQWWKSLACPATYLTDEDGSLVYQQNILKGRIAAGAEGTTFERLRTQDLSSPTQVTVQETATDVTYLNALNLLALPHADNTEAYIDQHGAAYQLTEGPPLVAEQATTEDTDVYTIDTHGAEGLLLTASLTNDTAQHLREQLAEQDRLQCIPGVYDLIDSLPAAASAHAVTTMAGISVSDQKGRALTSFPVVLEQAETTLLTIPKGTESVTVTTPKDAYAIENIAAIADLTPITSVVRYQPITSDAAASKDEQYERITHSDPAMLTFAPLATNANTTYYFESHGYYHYGEAAECTTPSFRYDVLWDLAGGIGQ